jgi:hypothetical protein
MHNLDAKGRAITRWSRPTVLLVVQVPVRLLVFRNRSESVSRFLTVRAHTPWLRVLPPSRKAIFSAQFPVCRQTRSCGFSVKAATLLLGDYAVAPHSCDRFFGTVMANFELACPSLLNPCSDTSEMGHMLLLRSKEEHHVSCAE